MRYLIAVVLCLAVAGCHRAGLREQLVGKWVDPADATSTLTFYDSGDMMFQTPTETRSDTWKPIDATHIRMESKNAENSVVTIKLSDDGTLLTMTHGTGVMEWKRVTG